MGRPGEKDSDAIHRSVPNELAGMTEKVAPAVGDLVYIESLADGGAPRKAEAGNLPGGGGGGGGLIGFGPFRFEADQFENPNGLGDWNATSFLAPAEADDNNDGIVVRSFNKTDLHPSVGFSVFVPVGAVSLKIRTRSRARVGPVAPATELGPAIDYRGIPDGAAVEAWHGLVGLVTFNYPITTEFFHYHETLGTITLVFLGITAGRLYQFMYSRNNTHVNDLDDDLLLKELEIEFFDS